MGHDVQLPRGSDVACETLSKSLCDQGNLGGGGVVDLYYNGCRKEAGEARWMCDPCVLEAVALDLSRANVTHLDEGLVSAALHGLDQLL